MVNRDMVEYFGWDEGYCDLEVECCSLREIKVSNCNQNKEKEATMCDSYSPRKD